MHARSGLLQISPDKISAVVSQIESDQIPRYREQSGYRGFTVLVDRQGGKILGVSFWDSAADLEASEALGKEAREQAQQTGGGEGQIIREAWEVALDDMV